MPEQRPEAPTTAGKSSPSRGPAVSPSGKKPVSKARKYVSLVLLAGVLVYGAVWGKGWYQERQQDRAAQEADRKGAVLSSSEPVAEQLEPAQFLEGHPGGVQALAFSPDGATLVSGGSDQNARLWDMKTGKVLQVLDGHDGIVWGVSFSSDGARVASAGADGEVMVWEAATGELIAILEGHTPQAMCVRFLPDGTLLSGGAEGTLRRWDVDRERTIAVLRGHRDAVNSIASTPDGRRAASGSRDGAVMVWNLEKNRMAWRDVPPTGPVPVTGGINCVAFSPDGTKLYAVRFFGFIYEYDAETGEVLRRLDQGMLGTTIDVSADGKRAAVGSELGPSVWTLSPQKIDALLLPRGGTTSAIAFSPDGRFVAAGHGGVPHGALGQASDARVMVWNLSALKPAPPPKVVEKGT